MDGGRRSFGPDDRTSWSHPFGLAEPGESLIAVFRQRWYVNLAWTAALPMNFTLTKTIGHMRNIHQFHPITFEEKIKVKKNKDLSEDDVAAFSSFLRSMLQYRPRDRQGAGAAAMDSWLLKV